MVYVYSTSHRMRKEYSSKLILIITLMDLLLTLKFLVSAVMWKFGLQSTNSSFHIIDDNCVIEVLYGSFTSMASQSWNFCWVVNFLLVLYNPLRSHRKNMKWYHLFSWTMSTAAVVYALASESYHKSDRHQCWFSEDSTQLNLLDIPLLFYMIVACISLAYAGYRLFPGLKAFKRSRMALFSRHAAYVVAFVTIWIWPLLNALLPHRTTSDFFYVTDATLITGQAVVFASIRLLEPGAQRALRRSCRRKPTKPGVRRENSVRAPLLLYGPIVPRMHRDEPGDGGGNSGHHSYGTPQNAFDRAREKQRRKQRQRQGRHDGSGKHTPMSRSPNMAIGRQHRQQQRQSQRQRQRQHSDGTEPSDNSHSASSAPLSDDPAKFWGYRFRRDMFDVALDLRVELALYMLSGLCNVMMDPARFQGTDSDGSSRVAVQQTFAPDANARHPRIAREVSTQSVLLGDSSDVVVPIQPMAYLEYSVRRHGRIHISSKSKKQKTRLVITPIDANVPTPRDVKRQHSVSSRRRRQRSEDSDGPPSLAELSLRTMAQESLERAAEANGFKTPVRKAPRTLGRMPHQRPLSRVDVDGFELIVYQPNSFMALRNAAGLKGSHIAASLSPNAFRASELKAHFSEGASSSFFCRSKDERFVLKTAEQSEVQTLLKMLPAYIAHLSEHPQSLLVRFYGCYAIKAPHAGTHYFVLMGNVMPMQIKMTEMYDLKFSTTGRRVPQEVQRKYKMLHQTPLLKDLDFREKYPHGIRVPPRQYTKILMQLHYDTQLLASQGIMDYSLLLGIKRVARDDDAEDLIAAAERAKYQRDSTSGDEDADAWPHGNVRGGAAGGAGAGFSTPHRRPNGTTSNGNGNGTRNGSTSTGIPGLRTPLVDPPAALHTSSGGIAGSLPRAAPTTIPEQRGGSRRNWVADDGGSDESKHSASALAAEHHGSPQGDPTGGSQQKRHHSGDLHVGCTAAGRRTSEARPLRKSDSGRQLTHRRSHSFSGPPVAPACQAIPVAGSNAPFHRSRSLLPPRSSAVADELEDGYASEDLPDAEGVDDVTAGLRAPVVVREVSTMQPWSQLSAAPLLDDRGTPESAGSWEGGTHGSEPSFIEEEDGDGAVGLIQVGLVDILQTYDLSKMLEHGFKSLRGQPKELSSVEPTAYAARFSSRVASVFRP